MRTATALTLVEMLVIIAIIAVSIHVVWHPSSVAGHARSVATHVAGARFMAVASGVHVSFEERPCQGTPRIVPADGASLGSIRVFPLRGLQFTPDGLPRTCDGGGVGNTTILLEHRGRQAAVIVSSLGRVRWELR